MKKHSPPPAFALRTLVKDLLDQSDEAQPDKLARLVADAVPTEYLRGVLAETLEGYVRVIIDRRRSGNPLIGWSGAPPITDTRSAKVQGIRDAWLQDRVHVGSGTWKHLGDCTYQDLMHAALERRRMARLSNEAADRFEALAGILRGRGVGTVAELPITDLLGLRQSTP